MRQFGTDYSDPKNFKKKLVAALKKVQAVYPQLKIQSVDGGVKILPKPPRSARFGSAPPSTVRAGDGASVPNWRCIGTPRAVHRYPLGNASRLLSRPKPPASLFPIR